MSKHTYPNVQFPVTVHVQELNESNTYHIIDADHMTAWIKTESQTYLRRRHIAEAVPFLWELARVRGTATFHGIATYRIN